MKSGGAHQRTAQNEMLPRTVCQSGTCYQLHRLAEQHEATLQQVHFLGLPYVPSGPFSKKDLLLKQGSQLVPKHFLKRLNCPQLFLCEDWHEMFSAFVWSEFQTYVVENKGGDGKMIMYQSVSVCIRSTKCTVAAIACLIPLPASFSGLLAIRACQSVGIKKCLLVPIHPTTKSDSDPCTLLTRWL